MKYGYSLLCLILLSMLCITQYTGHYFYYSYRILFCLLNGFLKRRLFRGIKIGRAGWEAIRKHLEFSPETACIWIQEWAFTQDWRGYRAEEESPKLRGHLGANAHQRSAAVGNLMQFSCWNGLNDDWQEGNQKRTLNVICREDHH